MSGKLFIANLFRDDVWHDIHGTPHAIGEMFDQHLVNTIQYLDRKLMEPMVQLKILHHQFPPYDPDFIGDMSQLALDHEEYVFSERLANRDFTCIPVYVALTEEKGRRNARRLMPSAEPTEEW